MDTGLKNFSEGFFRVLSKKHSRSDIRYFITKGRKGESKTVGDQFTTSNNDDDICVGNMVDWCNILWEVEL